MPGSRRAWGWHRLEPHWAERIVADARVGPGDLVLDVGAGLGALTAPLLASGARVIAVEPHADRARQLRARFPGLVVVETDASDLRLPRRPFHVVANPPFAIASDLLHRLVHRGSRLRSAHLVLPTAVARRWAGPDAPAVARWRRDLSVELGRTLPRSAFRPPPKVSCRVLVLRRRPELGGNRTGFRP